MKKLLLIFLFTQITVTYAQNNTVSSGGVATGQGGSLSYTIGQVAYNVSSGNGISIIQGLQQPLEVSVLTSISELGDKMFVSVYPNPTNEKVLINLEGTELRRISYQLTDFQGRQIHNGRITNLYTYLNLSPYSSGIYILKLFSGSTLIQSYKIIKTK